MAKKKEIETPNVFGGFEALSKSLLPGSGPVADKDDEIPYIDPEDIEKDEDLDEEEEAVEEPKKPTKKTEEPDEEEEEIEEIEKPKGKTKPTKKEEIEEEEESDEETDESSEEDENLEGEVTTFLKDRLSEELGWELDEDDKFESIKDVVDYMKYLVEENSKPKYHSEDIKALDEYVKNGGTIDKYFKEVYGASNEIDFDNLDLSRESNQRLVVRELLRTQGISSEKIQKRLDRYEKEEILADEAEDAVELLKEYKTKSQKKLLEDQKKQAEEQLKSQQKFVENVQNSVKSLDNIRGIKISSKEKSELLDYIFKPDSDGLTKYQKDYMSDIRNLIESAYFTKMGDSLINEAKKKGSSDAYKEFHQKLKANKGKRSKNAGSLESGSDSDLLLSSLSKSLLNKV